MGIGIVLLAVGERNRISVIDILSSPQCALCTLWICSLEACKELDDSSHWPRAASEWIHFLDAINWIFR
jgi:hypothetical protein